MSTQKNNIMNELILQAKNLGQLMIMALSTARVLMERVKANDTARKIGWGVLAALVLVLTSLVSFRTAQAQQEKRFEAWQERFVNEYLDQQDAARRGMPIDPRVELRKQEATAFAKLMSGLKLYGYGTDDFRTLAQGVACRVANPGYPNTIVEVIEQKSQWPGYADTNEVTQKDFDLAMKILAELDAQEHPPISSDYVYASFERDGISLRDTWDIGTRTHFWRAGE